MTDDDALLICFDAKRVFHAFHYLFFAGRPPFVREHWRRVTKGQVQQVTPDSLISFCRRLWKRKFTAYIHRCDWSVMDDSERVGWLMNETNAIFAPMKAEPTTYELKAGSKTAKVEEENTG